jgi:tetratricopeptide (TPR) repeat protein
VCARQFAGLHPKSAEAQHLLATILSKREMYAEAAEADARAVALDPSLTSAYLTLGSTQQKLGRTVDALDTYNRALVLQPNFPPLLTLIGNLYMDNNDLDSARKSFQRALMADPNFAVAESNLAWVCAQQNLDLDHALNLAQKAREQMPALVSMTDTLGWVNYKKGNYLAARSLFQECVRSTPKQASYHYHLGLALLASGDRSHAKAELQNALRLKLSGDPAKDARQNLENLR